MFYNNLYVNAANSKHIEVLSVKQLYNLYIIFNKTYKLSSTKNLLLWYSYVYIITINFNLSCKRLFVSLLYYHKTNKIIFLKNIQLSGVSLLKHNPVPSNQLWPIKAHLSKHILYWIMWASRRKIPINHLDFRAAFMQEYLKKVYLYAKLGFIILNKTCDVYQTKLLKLKNFVIISKPILLTPKYSSSTVHKHLHNFNLNNFEFQFLRKNKVYNKGRYSRTRQNYRTGVYLCMYFSVISLFGLYYWFYRFSFNFTYLWWLFISFGASFFLPKIIKYRLYEPSTLLSKFYELFKWTCLLFKSLLF